MFSLFFLLALTSCNWDGVAGRSEGKGLEHSRTLAMDHLFQVWVFVCPVAELPKCGDLLDAITSTYRRHAATGQCCKLIGRPDGPT